MFGLDNSIPGSASSDWNFFFIFNLLFFSTLFIYFIRLSGLRLLAETRCKNNLQTQLLCLKQCLDP